MVMPESLLDGRYLVRELLGSGGEADIFRAHDQETGESVALRRSRSPGPYGGPLADLPPHPGWVLLRSWGRDSNQIAYQVFELLEGETLDRCVTASPLDRDAWRAFVDQSLDAVQALHESGWVHGDLNPGNLIRCSSSPSLWKLLELPFLRFSPPGPRSPLFGNIHTLAPEQFNGVSPHPGSDLYSLGCLYYYAACGEFPHAGGTTRDIAISHLRFAPEPLELKAPGLPVAWCSWTLTLLAREPENRFPSVSTAHHLLGVA